MIRLLFLSALSLGLVACGDDTASTSEDASNDMTEVEQTQTPDPVESVVPVEEPMEDAMAAFDAQQAGYLAEYAGRDGTQISDSGLMYQVVREGEGANPNPTDIVEVHYEGRLIDGTIFDSSYARDETIEFPLNRVIPGWTEGLQYMQPGAEHILVIPPELGYGARGAGEVIPPNAVLIFRVELFNVTPAE